MVVVYTGCGMDGFIQLWIWIVQDFMKLILYIYNSRAYTFFYYLIDGQKSASCFSKEKRRLEKNCRVKL